MTHEQPVSHGRCVIIAAGPFSDVNSLRGFLREDDGIIAADGGWRLAGELGVTPSVWVADFDSSEARQTDLLTSDCEIVRLPKQKDDTDTLAAARLGLQRGYREFLLLGGTGGRLDHLLANLAVMQFLLLNGAEVVLADEQNVVFMHRPGRVVVEPVENTHLSLLPYGGSVAGLTVRNAAYPLENATLTTDFPLGVSNEFIGHPVEISFEQGILMIFLSKD